MSVAGKNKWGVVINRWLEHPATMVRELFKVEPQPFQEDVLEAFPHKKRIAMKASKGVGKLQNKSMLLDTPMGLRRWGDLKVGDEVFAEDGSPTKILRVFDNGIMPMYCVTFDDGSSTLAGGGHLWKVRGETERRHFKHRQSPSWTPGRAARALAQGWPQTRDDGYAVLTTEQIIERGIRVKNGRWAGRQFEIPRHGAVQFPDADQALDPYLTGVWLGDGSKGSPGYTKPYVEVEEEINRRGYKTTRRKDGKNIYIHESMDEFSELECFHCGSHERFIPNEYKYASVQQRKDLLCGLMDTDGCIGGESHMEYSTTSGRLAEDVIWLVRSLGGVAFLKEAIKEGWYRDDEGNRVDCRDCYRVTVRIPFNPFKISHKAERWVDPLRSNSTSRYMTRYIDKIEPVGEEDSMCIEIAHPSHCYLTNDFIVTHNSSTLAWLIWNFMLRRNAQVLVTSISGDNLKDGTWKELSVWYNKSPLLQQIFTMTSTRISAKSSPDDWFASARTWPKAGSEQQQADSLAGFHSPFCMGVIDEAGGVPDAVMAAAEAILSTGVETKLVISGNPTHRSGPLFRACTTERDMWHVVEISSDPDDPKRSTIVDIEWAREYIRKYGRDDPRVLVNIFGLFPPYSFNALIGGDEVREAMQRGYRPYEIEQYARLLGIDVARQGEDFSVICKRQGLQAYPFIRRSHIETGQIGASLTNRIAKEFGADAIFVDATGGFGHTWIDAMGVLGLSPIGVQFAQRKGIEEHYYNKRAAMYFDMIGWIKNGGALASIDDDGSSEGAERLIKALENTTYTHKGDQLILDDKDDIKDKIRFSPDEADALALTFAEPISPKARTRGMPNSSAVTGPYRPFSDLDRMQGGGYTPGNATSAYDPFRNR